MTILEYGARNADGASGWRILRRSDGRAAVCLGSESPTCDGQRATMVVGTTPLPSGGWHYLALTTDNGRVTLYVDGKVDGTGTFEGAAPIVQYLWLRFGSDEAGTAPLRGRLDEVEIYNRALTAQEILERGK